MHPRQSRRSIACWLLLLALSAVPARPEGDFQLRPAIHIEEFRRERVSLLGWAELRWTEDASRLTNWRVGQRLQYRAWREVTLGLGYTCIRQDGLEAFSGREIRNTTHRAELEATPRIHLTDSLALNGRGRLENRWIEDDGDWNPQLRLRPELVWTLRHAGPLSELFASDEVFYDLKHGRHVFNRLIPGGLTLELGAGVRLRLLYIVDSREGADGWRLAHAFQTQLHYSFR
jgi:hypothetical protein